MGMIPEHEIERLKREISVVELAQERGVELKRHGEELLGLCPFHDDKSPSLVVNPGKNLWHCLGACQAGGSPIDWVMHGEKKEFRAAVGVLQQRGGGLSNGNGQLQSRVPEVAQRREGRGNLMTVKHQEQLKRVIDYYHETLKENAEAQAYLEKRGIANKEAIERFKLGYCDRSFGLKLPLKNRKAGAEIRGELEEIGILRETGHEHFRGSLVVPVMDANGMITEVYGRKIGSRLRKGTPLHLYLPGPHRGVWNSEALMVSDEIVLCESLIDALTFWCAGLKNVTCAYGIEGFTKDHFEALLLHGIARVYIAYDRDDAGDRAAKQLCERLVKEDIECFRVLFPKGMDANEYALKVQPASESLDLCIRKAKWIGGKRVVVEEAPVELAAPAGPLRQSSGPSASRASGPRGQIDEQQNSESAFPRSVASRGGRDVAPEIKSGEITFQFGERKWRVRGLEKNMSFDALRVNVLVGCNNVFHVDTFDLYSARHRQGFIKQAALELELKEDIIKKDFGKLFLQLEVLQEKQINEKLAPKEKEAVKLTEEERAEALALLKSPDLTKRILEDFEKCGVVGEQSNKLVGYLGAVSRKLEEPLAVVVQSSSAAGKSALMEAVLAFLPREEQVKYSAMTGQSLFYMGETDLKNKILAIVEEEGAERAAYALKLLQSEGELTIASTGKDPATGRLVTQEYRVEGPVMIFLTTTAVEIDEELLNRCIVLTVDENREQTRAIHALQRERQTLEGLLARRDGDNVRRVHQNAQRLLRPLLVANPFARELTFVDTRTRTRRDHMKYLTLIRAMTLLHQYQRPVLETTHNGKTVEYIEVTPADIEAVNGLCHRVLGRSLDELAPQTRRLLVLLDEMVKERSETEGVDRSDFWFTRREAREYSGFGSTQIKIHMHRLEELEYVIVHRGGRGQQFVYELAYEGQGGDGTPFLPNLLDVSKLKKQGYDAKRSGVKDKKSAGCRGQVGVKSEGCRRVKRPVLCNDFSGLSPLDGKSLKIALREAKNLRRIVPTNFRQLGGV